MQAVSLRWNRALASPHTAAIRCEVWDRGIQVSKAMPFISGDVTDKWVSGIRRNISLTVPQSPRWREILSTPLIELRPFRGINYGTGAPETVPLGRFPVVFDSSSANPEAPMQIEADDRWQLLVADDFYGPTVSGTGLIRTEIARLVGQTALGAVTDTATSTATMGLRMYENGRHAAIMDLCEAIGAEIHVDRLGVVILRNRPATTAPVYTVESGDNGTMVALTGNRDWQQVFNIVAVRPTATYISFPPVIVSVTDPADPAHPSRIGRRVYRMDTSLVADVGQARTAGLAKLRKLSAPQRSLSVTCVPNAALDASDCLGAIWPDGTFEAAQIDQINHPLTNADAQQISTILNRAETP